MKKYLPIGSVVLLKNAEKINDILFSTLEPYFFRGRSSQVGSKSNGGVSGATLNVGAKIDPFFEGHTDVSNTWMPFHINLMGEK